jgi:hypothetical protein
MKFVKTFESFENTNPSKSYTSDQFDKFYTDVTSWCDENNTTCHWSVYDNGVESAKRNWDMTVNGDAQFTVCELGDKLIGILHTGDDIDMAWDNTDRRVDATDVQHCI